MRKQMAVLTVLLMSLCQFGFSEGAATEARAMNEARLEREGKEILPLEGVERIVFQSDTELVEYLFDVELVATRTKDPRSSHQSVVASFGTQATVANVHRNNLHLAAGRSKRILSTSRQDLLCYALKVTASKTKLLGPATEVASVELPFTDLMRQLEAKGSIHLDRIESKTGAFFTVKLEK